TDVAGSEDPPVGRAQVVVDDDASPRVECDAHGLQTETFDVGRAARPDQDLVDREPVVTAVDREVERLSVRPPLDRPNLRSERKAHALALEHALDEDGGVGILAAEDLRQYVEGRHGWAETAKGLRP